jgi:hypothetical protein
MDCDKKKGITPKTEAKIIPTTIVHNTISIEIDTGKALNINPNLSLAQINQLLHPTRRKGRIFLGLHRYEGHQF